MTKINKIILLGLLFHSILLSVYEGVQYFNGYESTSHVQYLWQFIFLILVIMWIDNDSRIKIRSERCFDYPFLVYIFSPIYVPYYFYRTRGFLLGTSFLLGIILLYSLSSIVQWSIYFIS